MEAPVNRGLIRAGGNVLDRWSCWKVSGFATMSTAAKGQLAKDALEEVFLQILPRMASHAKESAAPARGFMAFGLLMFIAKLRAEGVVVTRAELARRLEKSQQMFSSHVDTLVEFGLLSMTRVPGGHGTGTQWHLDLVSSSIVDALRPLLSRADRVADGAGATINSSGRVQAEEAGTIVLESQGNISGRGKPARARQGTRSAPRSRP
jgi:hypothetical protein